jgi:hypothetical protein
MRCHDFQAGGPETTLEAGQSFDATRTMEAGHPGDCYFYLSSTAGIGLLWPVMGGLFMLEMFLGRSWVRLVRYMLVVPVDGWPDSEVESCWTSVDFC